MTAAAKISEQQDFVRWWDANVGVRVGTNQHSEVVAGRATTISADDAERLTGFDKKRERAA